MGTRGEQSQRWVPRGVSDTVLGDDSPPGAMASLQNLIHDPTTPGSFICRPANTSLIDFSGLPGTPGTPGVITEAYQVGNIIFGLISITTGTYSGHDLPFAYNVTSAVFLTVSGITTSNVPVSQATSGAWTPPQMTLTGVQLVVTHIGFPGAAGNYFGWFDVTTPTVPVWHAGNTTGNALPSVPQACGTFNNRTRFACGSTVYYTDTLDLNMTASDQSQTIGDYTPVTTLAALPTGSSALNIIQGLLAFKLNSITLITGDPSTSNLGSNLISPSVGTAAPRSAVSTPDGVKFMTNDGIRFVNFFGLLSVPDEDLANPFINAVTPSRVAACFNGDIYRICTQNGAKTTTPFEDYWYDFKRKGWSGPHTFRYDTIVPINNDFALASNAITGKMWDSYSVQNQGGFGNTFVENGSQLVWEYETPPMTDLNNMYANCVIRTTLEIAAPEEGQTYNFTMRNESGNQLASASTTEASGEAIWGAFLWGAANWGASTGGLAPTSIPWNSTCISNRFVFQASGSSSLGFKIAGLRNGYKKLNYLLN